MKILIYGTGGVGGYFGVRLAESGNNVTFVARGKHLEAIQKNGLQLKSIDGDYTVFPAQVTDNISTLNSDFDLIILGVKSWQVLDAAKDIATILSENTYILPLQNGVDNVDKLLEVIDKKHILAGFCKMYARVEDYGVINHFAFPPELMLGDLNNQKSDRLNSIKKVLDTASFLTTIPEDIHAELWKKFMFICTVSGLGGLTRVSIGAMVAHKGTHKLLKRTIDEIYAIAKVKGIDLPENMADMMISFIESQPFDATSSTQRDLMEGRSSELENFNGYIVNQGKKLGIETPVNEFVYNCLLPQEQKVRSLNK